MDTCTICNSGLVNKTIIRRTSMRTADGRRAGGRVTYEAWCPNCEIHLRRKLPDTDKMGWQASPIKLSDLDQEISNEQLALLKLDFEKEVDGDKEDIFRTRERWEHFISMKKNSDQLYSYSTQGNSAKGYVIKRDIHLIGFFIAHIENDAT